MPTLTLQHPVYAVARITQLWFYVSGTHDADQDNSWWVIDRRPHASLQISAATPLIRHLPRGVKAETVMGMETNAFGEYVITAEAPPAAPQDVPAPIAALLDTLAHTALGSGNTDDVLQTWLESDATDEYARYSAVQELTSRALRLARLSGEPGLMGVMPAEDDARVGDLRRLLSQAPVRLTPRQALGLALLEVNVSLAAEPDEAALLTRAQVRIRALRQTLDALWTLAAEHATDDPGVRATVHAAAAHLLAGLDHPPTGSVSRSPTPPPKAFLPLHVIWEDDPGAAQIHLGAVRIDGDTHAAARHLLLHLLGDPSGSFMARALGFIGLSVPAYAQTVPGDGVPELTTTLNPGLLELPAALRTLDLCAPALRSPGALRRHLLPRHPKMDQGALRRRLADDPTYAARYRALLPVLGPERAATLATRWRGAPPRELPEDGPVYALLLSKDLAGAELTLTAALRLAEDTVALQTELRRRVDDVAPAALRASPCGRGLGLERYLTRSAPRQRTLQHLHDHLVELAMTLPDLPGRGAAARAVKKRGQLIAQQREQRARLSDEQRAELERAEARDTRWDGTFTSAGVTVTVTTLAPDDLAAAGREMRNCAAGYRQHLESGRLCVVMLRAPEHDPVMAAFHVEGNAVMIDQISRAGNARLSPQQATWTHDLDAYATARAAETATETAARDTTAAHPGRPPANAVHGVFPTR